MKLHQKRRPCRFFRKQRACFLSNHGNQGVSRHAEAYCLHCFRVTKVWTLEFDGAHTHQMPQVMARQVGSTQRACTLNGPNKISFSDGPAHILVCMCARAKKLPPSRNECNYWICTDQSSSNLTQFIATNLMVIFCLINIIIIYITLIKVQTV